MELIYLFKALLRRKWLLILVPLAATALAILISLNQWNLYKSTAQLSTGITVSDPLSDERYNVFEEKVRFNNLLSTIQSPIVLYMLSYNLILKDLDRENPLVELDKEDLAKIKNIKVDHLKETFRRKLENFEILSTFNEEDRLLIEFLTIYGYDIETLASNLNTYREGQTDYIQIQFVSPNPFLSADAVNILSEEFIRYNNSIQNQRTKESVEVYEKLYEQKKKAVEVKSLALERFKSSQGVLNFSMESENKILQISNTSNALSDERKKLSTLVLLLQDINEKYKVNEDAINSLSSSSNSAVKTSNQEVVALQSKIRILNEQYVKSGLNNKNVLDSLDYFRNKRVQLLNSISSNNLALPELRDKKKVLEERKNELDIEILVTRENISSIQSNLNYLKSNVGTFATTEARISELQRDLGTATQEYNEAQEKFNAAMGSAYSVRTKVRQVEFGQPAIKPETKKKMILVALSGVTSFVFCVLAVGFISYIDLSLKSPGNFGQQVNLPLLGSISVVPTKKNGLQGIMSPSQSPSSKKTKANIAEDLRKIRFEIEARNKKVLLFTSTKESEGKTTLMYTLSQSLSLANKRILLIDANFSNNSLSKERLTEHNNTLEDIVSPRENKNPLSPIAKTKISNVHVVGCKRGDYSPSEIFTDDLFIKFITWAKENYDYILIEGQALNKYSGSKELVQYTDGVVVVFAADSSIKQTDQESIKFLQSLDDKLIGAILNKVEPENLNL